MIFVFFSVGFAATCVSAEGEKKEVRLSGCDSLTDSFNGTEATVNTDTYIGGSACLSVKSIMPCLYIGLGEADLSGMEYNNTYLEFYYYMSDSAHSEYYAAFVLSASSSKTSDGMSEKDNAKDAYVWNMSDFRGKLHSGWNYICLRLRDATYNKGSYNKEDAWQHLKYLTVADFAATKPEFAHMTDMNEKIAAGAYYYLTIAIDEVSLVSKPLDYGGADGDIEYVYHQRMEDIENRQGLGYTGGKDGYDFTKAALIILLSAASAAVVTEGLFLVFGILGRKKR